MTQLSLAPHEPTVELANTESIEELLKQIRRFVSDAKECPCIPDTTTGAGREMRNNLEGFTANLDGAAPIMHKVREALEDPAFKGICRVEPPISGTMTHVPTSPAPYQ